MKAYQGFKVEKTVLDAVKLEAARQSRSVSNLLALIVTHYIDTLEPEKEKVK